MLGGFLFLMCFVSPCLILMSLLIWNEQLVSKLMVPRLHRPMALTPLLFEMKMPRWKVSLESLVQDVVGDVGGPWCVHGMFLAVHLLPLNVSPLHG